MELDIIYADPPYALGSEVIIRKDGKVDYAKAVDFMNKWDMPDGAFWEKWFTEAFRSLKHGGYCVMFGIDRQLLIFKYYASLAGFEEKQSLYWYFISNFPKATDLSKQLDKALGEERESVGASKNARPNSKQENNLYQAGTVGKEFDITEPSSALAKKYAGYKYSVAPLKQTNETIMVFKKPTKTGSFIGDVMAYEAGDATISVGAIDIDGNRVGLAKRTQLGVKATNGAVYKEYPQNHVGKDRQDFMVEVSGRYPAQTFIDEGTAGILDVQGEITAGKRQEVSNVGSIWGSDNEDVRMAGYDDLGGVSKILHKCQFEQDDYDLYYYEPKVSGYERDAGLDDMKDSVGGFHNDSGRTIGGGDPYREQLVKNHHPTLKPISLNERVLKLFKTPNPQKICYPFAGSGSEIIGGIKAGFDDWVACELNPEYVEIAHKRIEYWKNAMSTQTTIFDFL